VALRLFGRGEMGAPPVEQRAEPGGVPFGDAIFRPVRRPKPVDRAQGIYERSKGESAVLGNSEFEEAIGTVTVEQGGDIIEIPWPRPAPKREHLVHGEIVRMQDRADVEADAAMQTTAIGKDFHGTFAAGGWIDRYEPVVCRGRSASRVTRPCWRSASRKAVAT
jgi:hypothetical protein